MCAICVSLCCITWWMAATIYAGKVKVVGSFRRFREK